MIGTRPRSDPAPAPGSLAVSESKLNPASQVTGILPCRAASLACRGPLASMIRRHDSESPLPRAGVRVTGTVLASHRAVTVSHAEPANDPDIVTALTVTGKLGRTRTHKFRPGQAARPGPRASGPGSESEAPGGLGPGPSVTVSLIVLQIAISRQLDPGRVVVIRKIFTVMRRLSRYDRGLIS